MAKQKSKDDACTDTETQVDIVANPRNDYGRSDWRDKDTVETSITLDPRLTPTRKAHGNSQSDVLEMWENMMFPTRHVHTERAYGKDVEDMTFYGVFYSWSSSMTRRRRFGSNNRNPQVNYEARVYPDGRGEVRYYNTVVAIRHPDGRVINNSNCGSAGFGRCEFPRERLYSLPLDNIDMMVRESNAADDQFEGMWSIVDVIGKSKNDNKTTRIGRRRAEYSVRPPYVVVMENGAGYVIGRDQSVNRRQGLTRFGIRIPPEQMERVHRPQDALDLLKPPQVMAAEKQGRDIKRQGEWWLVPLHDGEDEPSGVLKKCLPVATRKNDYRLYNMEMPDATFTDEAPSECMGDECHSTEFEMDARHPIVTCVRCGLRHVYGYDEVPDSIIEATFPDMVESLDDVNRQLLDSHTPRDLVLDGEDIFVRGTFRHTDNEHTMFNLGERWHAAYTHSYEAWTLEPQPWRRSGRGGGMD